MILCLWRIDSPSYWADEGVSVSIASRPLADLPTVLRHMDLVHGLYYVLLHFVASLAGTGEIAMRLPSAVATAAATAGLAALGRRTASPATGLFAGLIYALLPVVSRYAQEARQYALVTALVIGATYLLVVVIEDDRDRLRLRPWAAYTIMLTIAAWLHLYALFILPAHAVMLLCRRPRGPWTHWTVSVTVACVLTAPLALAARTQFGLVSWIPRPSPATVRHLGWLVFGGNPAVILTIMALAVLGVCAPIRPRLRTVALPWLVVPGGLMITVSLVIQPIFYPRYVLHCVAALALAGGAGMARIGIWAARRTPAGTHLIPAALLAVLAGLVGPAQVAVREPLSRPDNLRDLAHTLRDEARPGDAVLYVPAGNWMSVLPYPDSVAQLDTWSLHADRFFGDLPADRFHHAATGLSRIWLVEGAKSYGNAVELQNDGRFRRTAHWSFGTRQLSLYERNDAGRQTHADTGKQEP
ncbi:glycosyltransferase family 39 protein [Streptosporangium sp. NPDC087985]|uniref:glycosyltransferase family 39 protein n=1 Tax=Streptosporangium sp. NPDC087985 TaxID=3366196 RepID=UPI0038176401